MFNIRSRKPPTPARTVSPGLCVGAPQLHRRDVPGRAGRPAQAQGFDHPHDPAQAGREGLRNPQGRRADFRLPRRGHKAQRRGAGGQQLIDRFCGGSVEELLVGLVDNQLLEPKQLQRLAEKIASRKEKK